MQNGGDRKETNEGRIRFKGLSYQREDLGVSEPSLSDTDARPCQDRHGPFQKDAPASPIHGVY